MLTSEAPATLSRTRVAVFTVLALTAFAGNSLLCRMALKHTGMDAASFTLVRLVSGALMLALVVRWTRGTSHGASSGRGNWPSACALFAYAASFSFAYVQLPAATGALLLFGGVQATMIGVGVWRGERLQPLQLVGFVLAVAALVALVLPGLAAPPWPSSLLMLGAGVAWGVYSLRGKGAGDPTQVTSGNFLRTVPMALGLSLLMMERGAFDRTGALYAVLSGALASGLGYALWYRVLPAIKATKAATLQLSVPVLAALGGFVFLGEPVSWRTALASLAILGGIALVILDKKPSSP